jgi:flagellar basal body-associated protein FliL
MAKQKKAEPVKTQEKTVETSSNNGKIAIIIIVIVVVLAMCGLCSLCGGLFFFANV